MNRYRILNFVLFQSLWFLLVLVRADAWPLALPMLALMLWANPQRAQHLPQMLIIALAGMIMDSLLVLTGVFVFPDPWLPLWLCLLWLAFAMALPYAFAFLQRLHPVVQALSGIPAATSYHAGYIFGAVDYGYPIIPTLVVLSLLWALFLLAALAFLRQADKRTMKESTG